MDLIDYFSANHASLWFLIAGIAFVIELAVMGLSGLVLFFAIGCFITAILTYFGVLNGWESEVFSVGLLSCLAAMALWKPLKRFQTKTIPLDNSSDMAGREVPCSESINKSGGAIRYSGINWPARLDASSDATQINAGDQCVIVSVDGNVMLVTLAAS
jgi:membrane protein implicated in regulation of membrane protease activity